MLMVAYGRGRWAVSQNRIQIHPVPCEPSLLTALPKALLGSFSNDDDDGTATTAQKKGMGLLSKTTILHMHHSFLYISLPSLLDYDVKMPDFTLFGGRKEATTNFSFSF